MFSNCWSVVKKNLPRYNPILIKIDRKIYEKITNCFEMIFGIFLFDI